MNKMNRREVSASVCVFFNLETALLLLQRLFHRSHRRVVFKHHVKTYYCLKRSLSWLVVLLHIVHRHTEERDTEVS